MIWWQHGLSHTFSYNLCSWELQTVTKSTPLCDVGPNIAKWLKQSTYKAEYVLAKDVWRIMTKFSVCWEQWNNTHTGVKIRGNGWCDGGLCYIPSCTFWANCLSLKLKLSAGWLKFMRRDYRTKAVWKLEPYIHCVESLTGDKWGLQSEMRTGWTQKYSEMCN